MQFSYQETFIHSKEFLLSHSLTHSTTLLQDSFFASSEKYICNSGDEFTNCILLLINYIQNKVDIYIYTFVLVFFSRELFFPFYKFFEARFFFDSRAKNQIYTYVLSTQHHHITSNCSRHYQDATLKYFKQERNKHLQ